MPGKQILLLLLFAKLALAATPAGNAGRQSATPDAAGFVGSTVCKTCHPNVWFKFDKNAHFKSVASGKEAPENTGCEGCHGPGGKHVAAHGGKASIVAFSTLTPKQSMDACLRCHSTNFERANIHNSVHTKNEVSCTSCHSIHKAQTPTKLLAKAQPELCYGCHTDLRGQFSMPFKHRVNEGVVACSDCHNPHGTYAPTWRMAQHPTLLKQSLANEEACLKCHVDKRGPFAFEHPPVRVEGCESCHLPHGSTNSRLLRRPVVFTVCLECHNGAGTFGRTNSGVPTLSQAHNMADPRYQNCTSCHVRIHGSNTDPLFLR